MLTEENKTILALCESWMADGVQISPLSLEKALFNAFVWHFTEKRSWTDESIKKQAIKVEIEKLEKLINGNATDQDANLYLNQFNQYLHYNLAENTTLQLELMRLVKDDKWKVTFKFVRQLLKEKVLRRKYKTPESFLRAIENDANDLNKIDSLNISSRLNNILSGYKGRDDERAEPLYKSLLQFKDYLGNYGKPGNELAEVRFKSNLSNEEIEAYFNKLTIVNNTETKHKGKAILSKEEISSFLYSNFRNFNPAQHKVMINANCSNASLIRFMYEFYEIESKIESSSASIFHKMLKENFVNFQTTELKTIRKEFARVHPVHFPFH